MAPKTDKGKGYVNHFSIATFIQQPDQLNHLDITFIQSQLNK